MAGDRAAHAFVTGADGFLGTELIKVLVALGHAVTALTRSVDGAERLRRAGATPVIGDLLAPGRWQDEAAAEWVFHLPSHGLDRRRFFPERSASVAGSRISLDANLLDAVTSGATRRIVYVADMSLYGAAGSRPITEDEPPHPSPSGRWLVPVFDRLDGYTLAGLPIVTAVPGCVYGNGAWFREHVIEPVLAGRRVVHFGKTGWLVSPIHVHDCASALVHLARHGATGGRYFVVNTDPIRMNEFSQTVARLANRRLRVWRLPARTSRLVVGARRAEYPEADASLSNIRLRGIGFRFEYPTIEHGIRQSLENFI